jgi:amino acid permease
MITLSLPLQSVPCRIYFLNLLNPEYNERTHFKKYRWLFTAILLIISYLIAMCGVDFEVILRIIGASVSSLMCFVFCSIYYLSTRKIKRRDGLILLSILTLGFGVIVIGGLIYSTIQWIMKEKTS